MPKRRRQEPVAAAETLTTNQVIAYNFARAREECGWTQVEASDALEYYLGYTLKQAGISSIERTFFGDRQRSFTATELTAFARCFGKPVGWFFIPPQSMGRRWVDPIEGSSWMRAHDLLGLILGDPSGWQSFMERISELLTTDSSDTLYALRAIFFDKHLTAASKSALQDDIAERRREVQLEMLQRVASPADEIIHRLAELVKELESTTLVGLQQLLENDPEKAKGLLDRKPRRSTRK